VTLTLGCPWATNVVAISGFYSQMTGVLAGFAFTAMVVLLTPTQVDERRVSGRNESKEVLAALFAAFIALVVATLNYAVLAGESMADAPARAYTAELVDGILFGLAAIMLFQGISLLLYAGRMDRLLIMMGRVVTVVVGPTLTYYYLVNGASDTETFRATRAAGVCVQKGPPGLGLALAVILAVVLLASMVRRLQPARVRAWAKRTYTVVPVAVLAMTFVVAVIGGTIGVRDPNFLISPTSLAVYLSGLFVVFLLLGMLLSLGAPDLPNDAISPPDDADASEQRTLLPQ
jgi:hypothetical protein